MRKLLDSRASPAESGPNQVAAYEEIDINAAFRARERICGMGRILRPQRGPANFFPQPLYEGSKAMLPDTSFGPPKIAGAPCAPQDPERKRAAELEETAPTPQFGEDRLP